ncbi:hypothetical protein M8542_43915 [Amycolatopsis sp. OK19-0408]|uniref:SURF1-like protein n=1 Tax=Amycolatopsis iheyensis TaxID=2945988 RepID=A0A9X2NJ75_9PSEU|nr:hypothetical protein [Amycolatopsis iheyensis]MCR6489781.1 hypothetical protein [Amycolatopsis iheyensis]
MTRSAWVVLAAVLLGLGTPVRAVAATPAWVSPTTAELTAAVAAAHTPQAVSYARTNLRRPGRPEPAGITVADNGIPAYSLDPAFVRGGGAGPAAILAYVAVVARTDDGRVTTIQARPVLAGRPDSGWRVGSALSGDDEAQLVRRLSPGSVLLSEPQINGWYELGARGVRLLRASLPQSQVGALVPLSEYQHQVHDRYAARQPGLAGPPSHSSSPPWWLFGLAAAAAVIAVIVGLRRRRSKRPGPLGDERRAFAP